MRPLRRWLPGGEKLERKNVLSGSERNRRSKLSKIRNQLVSPHNDDEFPLSLKENCNQNMAKPDQPMYSVVVHKSFPIQMTISSRLIMELLLILSSS
jgi:hypothetical protein